MTALAHPAPISGSVALPLPVRRRRHLELVAPPEAEQLADVIPLPVAAPQVSLPDDVPLRLTLRGRRVLATLLIVAAGVAGSVAGAWVSGASAPVATELVTVQTGDSLWSIASEVAEPGADVRDVMSEIASLNGLEDSVLVAGQQLSVPSRG